MTDDGKIKTIENLEDIPLRLAEGIIEGISSKPEDFIIMGMGFYVGWKGFDLLQYLKDAILGAAGSESAKSVLNARVELEKMMVIPGYPIESLLKAMGLADAASVSSPIMPYRVADPSIVPYSTGLSPEQIMSDSKDSDIVKRYKIWKHDTEARLVLGCLGAITATAITTPGFFSGIGEIVKGVGEIVPG